MPMSLLRASGSVSPAAVDEHNADHEAQQEKREIGEAGEFRNEHREHSEQRLMT